MHNISSYPHYANIDIVALIDTKIAKNNEIMQQENISLISSQLTSYETRISSLESKRKKSEELQTNYVYIVLPQSYNAYNPMLAK